MTGYMGVAFLVFLPSTEWSNQGQGLFLQGKRLGSLNPILLTSLELGYDGNIGIIFQFVIPCSVSLVMFPPILGECSTLKRQSDLCGLFELDTI